MSWVDELERLEFGDAYPLVQLHSAIANGLVRLVHTLDLSAIAEKVRRGVV